MKKAEENSSGGTSRRFTLRVTLVTAFSGLVILSGALTSVVTSDMVSHFIRGELRIRLADSVSIAASQIDVDLHHRIQSRQDEQSAAYKTLRMQLREIRDRGTDVRYIYTMRKLPDGLVIFVVDAEEKEGNFSHIGDAYTEVTPKLREALSAPPGTKRAFVEKDFSTDEWGTWLSAFIPLYTTDGQLDGVLGMDISAKDVIAHERHYLILVWAMSALVTLVVLPVGLLFAQRVRRPLAQLETEMEKVQHFDLDGDVVVFSRISEIHSMTAELENMKSGLRSFRKYVPADLVRQLITLGMDAELGGVERELTILFSDIASFTSASEKLSPERLVHFLGEYLDTITSVLLRHDATVDKYLGDGVMAFWGAPREMPDHAFKACLAALEMQQAIDALNQRWQAEGREVVFRTRIGINTGEVVVGNMGSEQRMSYTIIGDDVNLASRIEGTSKIYGTRILVSEATCRQVRDRFAVRLVDKVVVVGKSIPICLYELLDPLTDATDEQRRLAEQYGEAFQHYTQRRFGEAGQLFEQILDSHAADGPSRVLLDRCRAYMEAPPPPTWDGEFILPSK